MNSQEFRSELEIVVTQLRRIPRLSASCMDHLSSYYDDAILDSVKRNKFTLVLDPLVKDQQLYLDLLVDCYFLGFDLLESTMGYENTKREMRRWLAQASRTPIDLRKFGEYLKNSSTILLERVTDEPKGLSWAQCRKMLDPTDLYYWFSLPVFPQWKQWIETGNEYSFSTVYQWLEYCQRMTVESLDLVHEMMLDYKADEDRFHHQVYDSFILSGLRAIISDWFPRSMGLKHSCRFSPKHGAGATSHMKRSSAAVKYNAFSVDRRLFRDGGLGIDLTQLVPDICVGPRVFTRMSEIVAVPKSMLKNRIISKEPVALMFFQQGWRDVFYGCLRDRSCALRDHVCLEKADDSASLARFGSFKGDFATIDLSAASDSVTCTLIREIFPHWMRNIMFACRSDQTQLPTGEILSLEKYAPMGSNLCFITETIVFAAFCELALRRSNRHTSYYKVYGDDIVIESDLAQDVKYLLESMHFRINQRKSYCVPRLYNFREACGGEYLNGKDVTPLRVSRRRVSCPWILKSPERMDQLLADANNAFDKALFTLRRVALRRLKRCSIVVPIPKTDWYQQIDDIRSFIPYTESGNLGIKTFPGCATNFHLKRVGVPKISRPFYGGSRYVVLGVDFKIDPAREYHLYSRARSDWNITSPGWTEDECRYFQHLLKARHDIFTEPELRFWEQVPLLIRKRPVPLSSHNSYFCIMKTELQR